MTEAAPASGTVGRTLTLSRIDKLPKNVKLSKEEIRSWMLMPTEMPAVDCVSSNVKAYGWDAESRTLKVIFSNSTEYRYLGVDPAVNTGLQNAKSKGSTLAIIKTMFQALKIDPAFYA